MSSPAPPATTATTTPSIVATSGTASGTAAAPTQSGVVTKSSSGGGNGFYNNQLFYILIAVLGAFALVSIINLVRTRRRRTIIIREADRLGLMVPGMPGYVPMRERPAFVKADGWRTPDWWEVEPDEGGASGSDSERRGGEGGGTRSATGAAPSLTLTPPDAVGEYGARGRLDMPPLAELHPLALIPEPEIVAEPVKPWSALPYFPNYVSYLRSAHDPRPPRFAPHDAHAFDSLVGEEVQVVVALRMPTREMPPPASDEDDDAVVREWGGVELGVASVVVQR